MYVGFLDSEKKYDRVSKEVLLRELINDVGGKFLIGIKSMYVNSLVSVRVKRRVKASFRSDSNVRQGYIMSSWLSKVYYYYYVWNLYRHVDLT